MRPIARTLIASALAFAVAVPMAGCGNSSTNEDSMAATKGTAAPNAPKSQKEFYEQQQAALKAAPKAKK